MGRFLPGFLIGATIGLLVAPKKGTEMRLELSERWQQLQNKLSNSQQSAIDASTTSNDDADLITLPADSLASVQPTSSPTSSHVTSSPFNRTSTDSASSTKAIPTPTVSPTASISNTTSSKQFKYNGPIEDSDVAPITIPAETLEDITSDTTAKLDSPYRNQDKSNTTNRSLDQ